MSLQPYNPSLLQEDLINIYRWFCSKQDRPHYLADHCDSRSVLEVLTANTDLLDHDCYLDFLGQRLTKSSELNTLLWSYYFELTEMTLSRREVDNSVYERFSSDLNCWLNHYDPALSAIVLDLLTEIIDSLHDIGDEEALVNTLKGQRSRVFKLMLNST